MSKRMSKTPLVAMYHVAIDRYYSTAHLPSTPSVPSECQPVSLANSSHRYVFAARSESRFRSFARIATMLKNHLMTTASRKLQTQFKTVHRSVKVRKYLCCTMWLAEATAGALRYGWQITRGSCTCRVLRSREVARSEIVAVEKQLARNCLGGLGSSTNFFSHVDVVVILPRSEWAWRYVVCCRLWHSASGDVRLAVHYLPFSCTATVSSGCCSSCCSPSAYSPKSTTSPTIRSTSCHI